MDILAYTSRSNIVSQESSSRNKQKFKVVVIREEKYGYSHRRLRGKTCPWKTRALTHGVAIPGKECPLFCGSSKGIYIQYR